MENPQAAFVDAAVWYGSLDEAEKILAAHPEIASCDIFTAALLGDDAAVGRFLELDHAKATAKGGPRGWDALTYLCFSKYLRLDPARSDGFLRTATALLDAGASPNSGFHDETHRLEPEWESVLYGAAGVAHHPEMTRLLLERGADPNDEEVPYHSPETLDNRALKVLVESGKLTAKSLVTMLIRKLDWHDDDGVAWLLSQGVDVNFLTRWGNRPLHHALSRGNPLPYFELLLDRGADPALLNKDGASAFALAARMARPDVLALFELRGFAMTLDPDDVFLAACGRGESVAADPDMVRRLQLANPGVFVDFAAAGNAAAVRSMLDVGFDVAAARVKPPWLVGETALHVASWRGHIDVVNLLIERGAPIEARKGSGETPLVLALRALVEQSEWTPNRQSLGIADALLKAGARVDSVELTLAAALCLGLSGQIVRLANGANGASAADKQLALSVAAFNGKVPALATLIDLGVDVNVWNTGPYPNATPLHNAVCSGSLHGVAMLVNAGARADAKDRLHQATPLAWAEHYQYPQIVNYLKRLD